MSPSEKQLKQCHPTSTARRPCVRPRGLSINFIQQLAQNNCSVADLVPHRCTDLGPDLKEPHPLSLLYQFTTIYLSFLIMHG